jgi:hypothetical protein
MAHRGPEFSAPPCPHSDAAGAFALGALSRRDREDFVAHLDSCPPCDTEVDSLLPVVRLLDTVRPR